MFIFLSFLFIFIPAIEISLIIKATNWLGGMNTFSIVVLTGIIGAYLAKSQGIQTFQKIQDQSQKGQVPATQLIHAFFIFGGGLLLMTPGFVTDLFGLLMVIPGTRHLIIKFTKSRLLSMVQVQSFQFGTGASTLKREKFEEDVIDAEFREKP